MAALTLPCRAVPVNALCSAEPAARACRRWSSPASARCPTFPPRTTGFAATSRSTSGSGRACAGRRVLDMACGEGYGSEVLSRSAAAVVGVDANPEAHEHARLRYVRAEPELRAGAGRDLRRAGHIRRGRVPADDRARPGPGGRARALPLAARARRRRRTCRPRTCSRSRRPARRSPPTPGTSRSTAPRSSAHCARRCSAEVQLLGAVPRPQARGARAGARAWLGRGPQALRLTKPFYDRFTPAIATSDFALRADEPRRRARLPRGLPGVSWPWRPTSPGRARARPAHHMPLLWRALGPGRSARSGCGRRSRPRICRCSTCSGGRRSPCR